MTIGRSTMISFIRRGECSALYQALSCLSEGQRAKVLEIAVGQAIDYREDSTSAENFKLLTHAIFDRLCIPHAKGKITTLTLSYFLQDTAEAAHAAAQAQKECAHAAMRIFQRSNTGCIAECEGTVGALFREIAGWWRDTMVEEEADCMIEFLSCVGSVLSSYRNTVRERWDHALREATDPRFPQARMLRHLKRLVERPLSKNDENIARILMISWARTCDPKMFLKQLQVFESLHDSLDLAENW